MCAPLSIGADTHPTTLQARKRAAENTRIHGFKNVRLIDVSLRLLRHGEDVVDVPFVYPKIVRPDKRPESRIHIIHLGL
jgi:hypothetical protein